MADDLSQVLARWQAAGIYDPESEHESDLRALAEFYDSVGIDPLEFADVGPAPDVLAREVNRVLLRPGRRMSLEEAADLAGIPVAQLSEIARAAGYAIDAEYTEIDVEAFKGFRDAVDLFSEHELSHFSRVLAQAMTQVAEASAALFRIDVGGVLDATSRVEFARSNYVASQMIDRELAAASRAFLKYAIERSTIRGDLARERATHQGAAVLAMAVGFVDLVGFTRLTAELDLMELSAFIADFEQTATGVILDGGGRVVKMIGDEVMFVAAEPTECSEIGLRLIEAFESATSAPRGAVAYGDVVARGGDYYGTVVNLAARMAGVAEPGELLVNAAVAESVGEALFVGPEQVELKGFDDPAVIYRRVLRSRRPD